MKWNFTKRQMLVLTGASLFQCALLGVLANSTGVLLTQIRMELELSMTEISAYYTIKSVVGALGGAFFAALFFKSDKKRYLLFNIFTLVASYLLLLVGAGNWLWYVAAALSGVSFCTATIMVPHVLGQWFPENIGFAIGFAMAFSGVGGAVFNPVASLLIDHFGWKGEILILSAVTVLITIPALGLMFGEKPPLAPVPARTAEATAPAAPAPAAGHMAVPFILCCLAMLGGTVASAFTQYISIYAQGAGYALAVGATLNSSMQVGNVTGKLIFGIACDKIGIWKTMCLAIACIIAASLCFILVPGCLPLLYVASLLYGFNFALMMISVSRCSVSAYGADGAKRYMGFHTSINSAAGAVVSMSVGLLYDATGSFIPILLLGSGFGCLSIIAAMTMDRRTSRA